MILYVAAVKSKCPGVTAGPGQLAPVRSENNTGVSPLVLGLESMENDVDHEASVNTYKFDGVAH
jgi:hypothetical protein